jgi:hypothetical protein
MILRLVRLATGERELGEAQLTPAETTFEVRCDRQLGHSAELPSADETELFCSTQPASIAEQDPG